VIVLSSTSKYRAQLLTRLGLDFTPAAPICDETPLPGELPDQLAARLSLEKAASLRSTYPQAIIIGSDQVASVGSETLGKPGTRDRAIEQLGRMSGQIVHFYTGLAVLHAESGQSQQHLDITRVVMRDLSQDEIERYVDKDQPLDCAGSFKLEQLGVSLFESVESQDPSALVGLPLIAVARCLRNLGINVP